MTPSPLAIIDTNVVVSGFFDKTGESPPSKIVEGMAIGLFVFVLSDALVAEYRDVLLRPAIAKKHGLSESEVDEALAAFVENAAMADPAEEFPPAPDPDDDHLYALLAFPETILVTGERRLIANPPRPGSVMSPRDFLDLLEKGGFRPAP